MTTPPERPKIYHITHVDNLSDILADGMLASDAAMIARGGPAKTIGMSGIKRRRLEKLEVQCHTGTKVGDYVPFYFCPRPIMLYVIHCANSPDLTYRGGQEPILHLEADLHRVVQWADASGVRWAFSLSNAGAYYVEFRSRISELNELDWKAIAARDFRDRDIQEGKQAEFLVFERFPFHLVDRIGVWSDSLRSQTVRSLARANQQTSVEVHPEWYY